MALVLTSAPSVEPVTLDEVKAHLRVDGAEDDAALTALIPAARIFIERALGRALLTQGWSLTLDAWPDGPFLVLPIGPVQAVSLVTTYAADDTGTAFAAAHTFLDVASDPPRLVLRGSQPWPAPGRRANGIEIALTAGYGDTGADVPDPLRHALLLLIAHWFERREPVVLDGAPAEVPATVAGLLTAYRRARL